MVFFFQAEDGIRDIGVTGVQTCALPILCISPTSARSRTCSWCIRRCRRRHCRSSSTGSARSPRRSITARGDRKRGGEGKGGDFGGARYIKKKKRRIQNIPNVKTITYEIE